MNNALDHLNGHIEMQSLMPTCTLPPPLPQTPTSRTKRLSLTLPLHHHHRTHNTINIPCNILAIYDHLKQRKQQGHTRINTRKEEQSIQDLKPKEARAANKNKNNQLSQTKHRDLAVPLWSGYSAGGRDCTDRTLGRCYST